MMNFDELIESAKKQGVSTSQKSFTTMAQVVAREDKRIALILSIAALSGCVLRWGDFSALSTGINLTASSPTLVLNLREHGALVRGPIYAAGIFGGPETLTIVESIQL